MIYMTVGRWILRWCEMADENIVVYAAFDDMGNVWGVSGYDLSNITQPLDRNAQAAQVACWIGQGYVVRTVSLEFARENYLKIKYEGPQIKHPQAYAQVSTNDDGLFTIDAGNKHIRFEEAADNFGLFDYRDELDGMEVISEEQFEEFLAMRDLLEDIGIDHRNVNSIADVQDLKARLGS